MEKLKTTLWGHDVELDIAFDVYEGETVDDSQAMALGKAIANWDKIEGSLEAMDAQSGQIVRSRLTPSYLYVPREGQENEIAVVCSDAEDPEHEMAVMFADCAFSRLVEEDSL